MNKGQTKAWPVISPSDRRLYVDQTELAAAFKVQISSFFADLRSAPDPASGFAIFQLLIGHFMELLFALRFLVLFVDLGLHGR